MARDLFSDPHAAGRTLAALRAKGLNFELPRTKPSPAQGWRIDDYSQELPAEEPGPPRADGAWQAARRILCDYDFVEPSIVRALYRAHEPLEGRDMVLELRLWRLRFHVGVRVGEVVDMSMDDGGRPARSWGWTYRTLEGHFEAGQMDYEVRKWLDTGEVEFRIYAFSRPAVIRNPLIRLGFRLFGRRKQTEFARSSCERMRRLTEEELRGRTRPPPRRVACGLVIRPAGAR
jgi:uncharacterized protein (UPF0548 family)